MKKPTRLFLSSHASRVYRHTAEHSEKPEDVSNPAYFAHVAKQLSFGDKIEVMAEDGSWYREVVVRATGLNEVITGLLSHVDFSGPAETESPDMPYEIKYRGPHRRYSIIRKSDGEAIRDDLQTKEAAGQWLKNHMAVVHA